MILFGPWRAWFIGTVGLLYVVVAWRMRSRHPTTPDAALAFNGFRAWWLGVACLFLLASTSIAFRPGTPVATFEVLLAAVGIVSVCSAVWGLTTYIVYIYTGEHRFAWTLRAYYAADGLLLLAGLFLNPSEGRAWAGSVANLTIQTGTLVSVGIALFLVPAIIACIFYASLYRRVESREQKLRLGLTSIAFVVWFGVAIIALVTGLANQAWWPTVGQSIGVIASLLVVVAYWPPRWLTNGSRGRRVL